MHGQLSVGHRSAEAARTSKPAMAAYDTMLPIDEMTHAAAATTASVKNIVVTFGTAMERAVATLVFNTEVTLDMTPGRRATTHSTHVWIMSTRGTSMTLERRRVLVGASTASTSRLLVPKGMTILDAKDGGSDCGDGPGGPCGPGTRCGACCAGEGEGDPNGAADGVTEGQAAVNVVIRFSNKYFDTKNRRFPFFLSNSMPPKAKKIPKVAPAKAPRNARLPNPARQQSVKSLVSLVLSPKSTFMTHRGKSVVAFTSS